MCDYSLAGVSNRLAIESEELVVYRFYTGSRGLASPADLPARSEEREGLFSLGRTELRHKREESPCAVCVPPGARLRLRDIPEALRQQFGVKSTEEVTFVQLSAEECRYRDAVRFQNGREVLLQKLPDGLEVQVLRLSSDSARDEERTRHWMERSLAAFFIG